MKRVIAAAIFNEKKEILLCRKASLPYYIFPGGKPEVGEHDGRALIREIKEELDCQLDFMAFLDVFYETAPDGEKIEVFMYLCSITGDPVASSEIAELFWYKPGYPLNYPLTRMTNAVLRYLHDRKLFEDVTNDAISATV